MATAFILLVAALAVIGLITSMDGNAKQRSEYYEENYKEVIPFGKRNLLPRGYPDRALAMPAHTQGAYNDTYSKGYGHRKRGRNNEYKHGNHRVTATLLFSLLIIITLAYGAMQKKGRTATGPINKAELYLKY